MVADGGIKFYAPSGERKFENMKRAIEDGEQYDQSSYIIHQYLPLTPDSNGEVNILGTAPGWSIYRYSDSTIDVYEAGDLSLEFRLKIDMDALREAMRLASDEEVLVGKCYIKEVSDAYESWQTPSEGRFFTKEYTWVQEGEIDVYYRYDDFQRIEILTISGSRLWTAKGTESYTDDGWETSTVDSLEKENYFGDYWEFHDRDIFADFEW